jgi:hypothetical protein
MPSPAPAPGPANYSPVYQYYVPQNLLKLGPPLLEGDVEDTREITIDKKGSIAGLLFDLLLIPINATIAMASMISRQNRQEKQINYNVRIVRPNGIKQVAIIQGDFTGAPMEIGDHVSIWGSEKNGIVYVNQAYNHTVNAVIKVKGGW